MVQTLAHRAVKTVFFMIVMIVVTQILDNPENYINHSLASKMALFISGDVNAESIYDAYFYIDTLSVLTITVGVYLIAMKLLSKKRKK